MPYLSVPSTYEGTNWRRVKLPQMMEVPEEFKRILSLPVIVELDGQTGEVAKVTISKREPEWSVNLKKGIVSLFQVKMESGLNTNMVQSNFLITCIIPTTPAHHSVSDPDHW